MVFWCFFSLWNHKIVRSWKLPKCDTKNTKCLNSNYDDTKLLMYKLDWVDSLISDPPLTSATTFFHFFPIEKKILTTDMWHVVHDMWHVTCNMWHVSREVWHARGFGRWTFCQSIYLALTDVIADIHTSWKELQGGGTSDWDWIKP